MQLTLLQVVQKYMDRTSGFPVASITDLDEALQVASVAEDVFYEMVQMYPNLLFTQKSRTLDSVGDITRPNYLKIPEALQRIQESVLYYNVSKGVNNTTDYKEIPYVTPLEFLSRTSRYTDTDTNTSVIQGYNNETTVVYTDSDPNFYTSFDGVYITTDSYNSALDSTLQASKTKVVSTEMPEWTQEDQFVIPIPDRLTSHYLNMVLDQAYNDVRQERNGAIAQKARTARIKLQQDSRQVGSAGKPKNKYGRQRSGNVYGSRNRMSNS